jgi:2-succinyl-6-hydroxy-2,4-cyclohexadiene-1-carboxylate synthase
VTREPTIQRRVIDVGDGLALHVEQAGEGPPLVLLHGFTGAASTWTPLLPRLSAEYATVAIDLPGHGHSSAPASPHRYALARFADDLLRVLDALAIDRVALLGYSMGGRAALRAALRAPDRVAALALESTSPGIADPARRAERRTADRTLADEIEREGVPAFVSRWETLPLWASQQALSATARAALRAQRERNDATGLANSLRGAGAGEDEPVLAHLDTIAAPVLLVAGALDGAYVAAGGEMARAFPNARLAVVPGAGHAVHLERPDELTHAVLAFLRGVPSSRGRWN